MDEDELDKMTKEELNKALAEVLGISYENLHIVCAYNPEKIRKLTEENNG